MSRIPLANTFGLPGIEAAVETAEKQVWFGERYQQRFEQAIIDSTVVDAGNTPTSTLRAGLLLSRRADGLYYNYDPDGSGNAYDATPTAVLPVGMNMLDSGGTAVDKNVWLLVGGLLKASEITSLDAQARAALTWNGAFHFDDDLYDAFGKITSNRGFYQIAAGAVTLTAALSGFHFIASGADTTVTLPTIANGLKYRVTMCSDHELVITGGADLILAGNDATATTLTITTAGKQIGAGATIETIYHGTTLKWLITKYDALGVADYTAAAT